MAEIVMAVIGKVSEYLVAPIGRHLGYLFCYRTHTDDLRDKVQTLRTAKDDLQLTIDEATRRGDEIRPIVQIWLTRVDQITGEAEELLMKKDDLENKMMISSCFNLKSRYQLGRGASKKAQAIVEIQEARNFPDGISHRLPPRTVTFKGYDSFESRVSTFKEIMDAVRDSETKIIGVWGMGGVGKTTLVKQVAELAKQENLFTTQVCIDVSWTQQYYETIQQGITKIQLKIADMLGFQFQGTDESTRSDELKQRLLQGENILIILDDIWVEVNLNEVGIPFQCSECKCKVLLSSRDVQLIRQNMEAEKCFQIRPLPLEEAWSLFNKTAAGSGSRSGGGGSLEKKNDPELLSIARKVVEECEGLPIAIVTIAKALRGKGVAIWKTALEELRTSARTNFQGVNTKVYSSLKLSYNHLASDEVKQLFLLCGFLGDDLIKMDDLLRYGLGLDLFRHLNSLEKARDKLITLVEILKDSSLLFGVGDPSFYFGFSHLSSSVLLRDADDTCVWMHDLVRKFSRSIASEGFRPVLVKKVVELQEWPRTDEFTGCACISLEYTGINELPEGLVCPKLECLLLKSNDDDLSRFPNSFFQEMKQLKALGLSGKFFTSLPASSSLCFLSNLQTLCLEDCPFATSVTAIGELKKLQVLRLANWGIQQLPDNMTQLVDLRALELQDCNHLRKIPGRLISNLTRLEYLCVEESWGSLNDESVVGLVSGLKDLKYLSALDLKIGDPKFFTEVALFEVEKLSRYSIIIGDKWSFPEYHVASRKLTLSEVKNLHMVEWFSKLLTKTQYLDLWFLDDNYKHVHKSDGEGFLELKYLRVNNSDGIQYIVNSKEWVVNNVIYYPKKGSAFPVLEKLNLWNLCNLDAVFYGPISSISLGELQILEAWHCESLRYLILLPTPTAPGGDEEYLEFPKLESLELHDLPKLVTFYSVESSATTQMPSTSDVHIPFFDHQASLPSLKSLDMEDLHDIKTLWCDQLPSYNSFCQLESLYIKSCPKLLNVCPLNILKGLPCLQTIHISGCESLEKVFGMEGINGEEIQFDMITPSSDPSLPSPKIVLHNLQVLDVTDCDSLNEVIQVKELPVGEEHQLEIVFTKLRELRLSFRSNSASFCSARCAIIKFPVLEEISVSGMEFFCKGGVSTPMLQGLEIDDSGEPNLNATIRKQQGYVEIHSDKEEEDSYGIIEDGRLVRWQ